MQRIYLRTTQVDVSRTSKEEKKTLCNYVAFPQRANSTVSPLSPNGQLNKQTRTAPLSKMTPG